MPSTILVLKYIYVYARTMLSQICCVTRVKYVAYAWKNVYIHSLALKLILLFRIHTKYFTSAHHFKVPLFFADHGYVLLTHNN